ncbi:MAG: rhodanese-like domain-containing protein [Candidatus Limnocylindrales bacterium]|jgi:rhodanese-related sulfurtransferase
MPKAGTHPGGRLAGQPRGQRRSAPRTPVNRNRLFMAVAGGIVALAAVTVAVFMALGGSGSVAVASPATGQTIVQGIGGQWTDVTPDRLAEIMEHKDFTLVDVKTPYIGEIEGTDLYIPYDQIAARASELPAARDAKILVYCSSGAESAQAAQTLLDLGYTNIWNLDGGMNAWQVSGRSLVNKNRR